MKIAYLISIFFAFTKVCAQPTVVNPISAVPKCPFAHFSTPSGQCIECLSSCSKCQNL